MNIRPASAADLTQVCCLLSAADLPTDDVTNELLASFLVMPAQDQIVGTVGLERYGPVALLRSLAVAPAVRGRGHGHALLEVAETFARTLDVRTLYLLTTTAEGFFASHGYTRADRALAPREITSTRQFSSLCPASAAFMSKQL